MERTHSITAAVKNGPLLLLVRRSLGCGFSDLPGAGVGWGKISDGARIRSLVNKLSAVMIWGIALYLAFSLLPR
ncbi:hypothetical protein NBRC111894_4347 [Sporolactobacillus inulinus]|uniref:Uncharacterized protein n=1 Tax=Sporolactobacillus inulinus TaxID=2078 RepID=A0A4Y1ZII6_9BACL|nr:hypothetical protein NBRC111894_4347 [Sporolactobacillus inulinus]